MQGVAVDAAGNVYFNSLNCVFKLDRRGFLTRVAGTSYAGYSGDGYIYIADPDNYRVRKITRWNHLDGRRRRYIRFLGRRRACNARPAFLSGWDSCRWFRQPLYRGLGRLSNP
jgi:hypothetical protein